MKKLVFSDTDCLESFLFVDAGYILEELFSKIIIPEQVYNELMYETTPSKVKDNFKKLNDEFVEIEELEFLSAEYNTYKLIENGFWSKTGKVCGPGESAAMALAHLNEETLASNNLTDVAEYVESLNIKLITSSMILARSVEKKLITKDDANNLWENMKKSGIKLLQKHFPNITVNFTNLTANDFICMKNDKSELISAHIMSEDRFNNTQHFSFF